MKTLAVVAAIALTGCAQMQLRPAPEAKIVPQLRLAAADEEAGVRIVVQPEAWRGEPEGLDRRFTPMKVTIENQGDKPVRICYEDFFLDTGQGVQYSPLPPFEIKGEVTQYADRPVYVPRHAIVPGFGYRGFYLAPWYMPYYRGLRPWGTPWAFSSRYYDTYYPRWTVKLPTEDMLAQAIPEGVVEPGGSLTGFLYFPALQGDLQRVTFRANLSGPRPDDDLATLTVPFEVG